MAFAPQEQLANIAVVAGETARLTQACHSLLDGYWQRPTYERSVHQE